MWGIAPSEFWQMSPREWWLIFDAKMAQIGAQMQAYSPSPRFSQEERDQMYKMHAEAQNG